MRLPPDDGSRSGTRVAAVAASKDDPVLSESRADEGVAPVTVRVPEEDSVDQATQNMMK